MIVPKMSRAHFVLIAETIRNLPVNEKTRGMIAASFAASLKPTNGQFKYERFIAACMPREHKAGTWRDDADYMAKRAAATSIYGDADAYEAVTGKCIVTGTKHRPDGSEV